MLINQKKGTSHLANFTVSAEYRVKKTVEHKKNDDINYSWRPCHDPKKLDKIISV